MDILYSIQNKVLENVTGSWFRSVFESMDWSQRLIGIKGLRGVGKTTLMLQYLKFRFQEPEKALYITADSPWFYDNSLFDTISYWEKLGGKLVLIDEIHKYPKWARELKVAFDTYSGMQFVFAASSAFDIFKAEGDLSRRAAIYTLPGMSFREYLNFAHGLDVPVLPFSEILENGPSASRELNAMFKPLPLFNGYLKTGYFPFIAKSNDSMYIQKLGALINTVLENDLASVQDYSPSNINKIKKLLKVIAESVPFSPNVSKLAERLGVGRVTVYNYLKHLEDAKILNTIHKAGKGVSELQKPDKIYIENTNLAGALTEKTERGNLRETFFINQIYNSGMELSLAEKGDFLVDGRFTFEVGGRYKDAHQIKHVPNGFRVLDDIEYVSPGVIPLWLFGLMY